MKEKRLPPAVHKTEHGVFILNNKAVIVASRRYPVRNNNFPNELLVLRSQVFFYSLPVIWNIIPVVAEIQFQGDENIRRSAPVAECNRYADSFPGLNNAGRETVLTPAFQTTVADIEKPVVIKSVADIPLSLSTGAASVKIFVPVIKSNNYRPFRHPGRAFPEP